MQSCPEVGQWGPRSAGSSVCGGIHRTYAVQFPAPLLWAVDKAANSNPTRICRLWPLHPHSHLHVYTHTQTTFFKKLAKREKNCQFLSWSESFYNFKKIEYNRSNSIYISAPIITPHTVGHFTSLVDTNVQRVTIILISLVIVTLTTKQPNQKLSSKILSLTGKTDACSRKPCHPPVLN